MATVAPSSDQAADLFQNLSLDSQPKVQENQEPNKKPSVNQNGTVESNAAVNGLIQSFDRSITPSSQDFMDPNMCYLPNGYPSAGYFYGGYGGTTELDDYSRYMNPIPDGVEMPQGIYGDNGAIMYYPGYGYPPHAPYSPSVTPGPTVGHESQLYEPQHYQYPTYFPPLTPSTGLYSTAPVVSVSNDVSALATAPDQKQSSVETANENDTGTKGNNIKSTYQNSAYNSNGSVKTGYQDPRFSFDVSRPFFPLSNGLVSSDGQPKPGNTTSINSRSTNLSYPRNQSGFNQLRPGSGMGPALGYMNRMYPSKIYGEFGNQIRSSYGYGSYGYNLRSNGRGWYTADNNKYKPRVRVNGYGNENMDGFNELSRGPRAKGLKDQKGLLTPVRIAFKGENGLLKETNEDEKENSISIVPDREQYNLADFAVDYTDAKLFIIKSYSEDDVHKSIKYNVWASTSNGNKKLDAAYQEGQSRGFPIFLFFSVNTSGQFVGLAEMTGPVDFDKSLDYWQQDKWNGCFTVKWHIVKDVPNSLLKHIILENNENKPVTNSRDTQEIKLEQGLQVLKIFKEHSSKTCILDDFGFYEARQKTIQEKKAKHLQFPSKLVWEGRNGEEKNKDLTTITTTTTTNNEETLAMPNDKNVSEKESNPIVTNPVNVLDEVSENGVVTNGC